MKINYNNKDIHFLGDVNLEKKNLARICWGSFPIAGVAEEVSLSQLELGNNSYFGKEEVLDKNLGQNVIDKNIGILKHPQNNLFALKRLKQIVQRAQMELLTSQIRSFGLDKTGQSMKGNTSYFGQPPKKDFGK